MRKLLNMGGRSAICAAALTLSPLSPNFNYAEASDHTDNCAVEAGRIVIDTEICVEEPIPAELGHNVMEDYRVWLVGGAVLTAVGIGLGAGLSSLSKRMGYLESDCTPESIKANLIRHQKDNIEREEATKARLDKIEAWWDARGDVTVPRYVLGALGGVVRGIWRDFRTARQEARDDRREERLARAKSSINRKGGFFGENTRS